MMRGIAVLLGNGVWRPNGMVVEMGRRVSRVRWGSRDTKEMGSQ